MMTLKKISHISGYSTSTVSKALNDCFDINVDTKKLIKEIACQYNYMPNKNAVALRKSKTHMIAVILPQVNQQVYSDLLFNIQKSAEEVGYRVLLYQSFTDIAKERGFLEEISDGSVDGAFMVSTNDYSCSKRNIPIAYLDMSKRKTAQTILDQGVIHFQNLLKSIK